MVGKNLAFKERFMIRPIRVKNGIRARFIDEKVTLNYDNIILSLREEKSNKKMEPNNSSIYEENPEYAQILENQREKRITQIIQRSKKLSCEIKAVLTRVQTKTPVADIPESIRYYEREIALSPEVEGNLARKVQRAEIQGRWPRKGNSFN